MVTRQQIMEAVEKDEEYLTRKQELRDNIDRIEGKIFELREQLRELHHESDFLYEKVYNRIQAEMKEADRDA